ncbi:DUF4235 domain-containing protein [Demequina aurantiaca]|uniref:DUF4235 domain-containing protein n=1 Tax=Demequina aurantiaca TaxID=676200 RepID=UPI003D34516B
MSDTMWNLGTTAAALVGASAAKKISEVAWKKATGNNTPDDPDHPNVHWGQAIAFAALSGALAQVIRMAITRQSTRTYINATGHHPEADKA